jgi:chromate transporter
MKRILEIFFRFLGLGCISFGGPAAHIGYFRKLFVEKLSWESDESYTRLIALSQFLPGPGSSQVGFALGLRRAGLLGGIAAFIAFTLPSFILLYSLATWNTSEINDSSKTTILLFTGVIQGLKWMAVVVVSDAIINMYSSFCKTKGTITIALGTAAATLLLPSIQTQLGLLVLAAAIGIVVTAKKTTKSQEPLQTKRNAVSWWPLILFALLLIGAPLILQGTLLNTNNMWLSAANIFSDFYQSGSLVFGGGHVVLPMLQQTLGENITPDRFLLGYAAAQAIPGPMFTFATFLGADIAYSNQILPPLLSATISTLGIFLPGFLLVLAFQGAWESLAQKPRIAGAVWGINASVVGLLLSAWYNPVWSSAVKAPIDLAWVLLGFLALRTWKIPIVWLILGFSALGGFMNYVV